MPKQKPVKRKVVLHDCPHCDLKFPYPVDYCHVGEHHCHEIFMGYGHPPGVCAHCAGGGSKKARDYWRKVGKLKPNRFDSTSWDAPEWYDGLSAWRNETIEPAWCKNDY